MVGKLFSVLLLGQKNLTIDLTGDAFTGVYPIVLGRFLTITCCNGHCQIIKGQFSSASQNTTSLLFLKLTIADSVHKPV